MIGGPPCQGFSQIGRAKLRSLLGEEEALRFDNTPTPAARLLYRYFLAVVRRARPVAFVMENVPGMRTASADSAARALREAPPGYTVRAFLLNAAHYGVPQHRWRIFLVGLRNDLGSSAVPAPPLRTHRDATPPPDGIPPIEGAQMIHGMSVGYEEDAQASVTIFEALQDLPCLTGHLPAPHGQGRRPKECRLALRRRPSGYVEQLRGWPGRPAPEMISGNWYRWTPRDYPIFARMAEGDRYPQAIREACTLFEEVVERLRAGGGELPEAGSAQWEALRRQFVPPYRNDAFADKWHKLEIDRPSWTVTAHLGRDGYSHIHYDSAQARTVTIREAARLQSFPDAFEFSGQFGDQFSQIGNAVPPLLARAIARKLFRQLEGLGALPRRTQVGNTKAAPVWA